MMFRRHARGLSVCIISLLLVLPSKTLMAREHEIDFDKPEVRLDGVLTAADFDLFSTLEKTLPDSNELPEFDTIDLTDTEQLYWAQQDMDISPRPEVTRHKSFGRWLKKYWYIPTILAVGAGVLLLDDDSDDPNEVDD